MSSRVGDLLVRTGLITPEQLTQAQTAQKTHGGFIGSQLVSLGFIEQEDLLQTISQQYGVPIIEMEDYSIDEEVLSLIPQNLATKHGIIPLVRSESSLTAANTT